MKIRKPVAVLAAVLILAASGVVGGVAVQQYAGAANYASGADYIRRDPAARVHSGFKAAGWHSISLGSTGDAHLVRAVAMNITVSGQSGAGYLTLYNSGTGFPNTSNANWNGNEVVSNFCTCAVRSVGTVIWVDMYISTNATVSIDWNGKYQV